MQEEGAASDTVSQPVPGSAYTTETAPTVPPPRGLAEDDRGNTLQFEKGTSSEGHNSSSAHTSKDDAASAGAAAAAAAELTATIASGSLGHSDGLPPWKRGQKRGAPPRVEVGVHKIGWDSKVENGVGFHSTSVRPGSAPKRVGPYEPHLGLPEMV